MGGSYQEAPREGDCDLCGTPIPAERIRSSFNRQTGSLTCDDCQHLENILHRQQQYDD